ncbi:MAG: SURF1 family protein [Bdellovibrionales bacterium]
MTQKPRSIPLWATLFTCLGFIILCALGSWQIKRMAWKNDIIEKLETAYASDNSKELNFSTINEEDFAYGQISGKFLFDQSIPFGHHVQDSIGGHTIVTPVKTMQGMLLVDLGFNPSTQDIRQHPLNELNGQTITFKGLARSSTWNNFIPENDPSNDIWYRYDIEQIANAKNLGSAIPFILFADHAKPPLKGSFPSNEKWSPNNNHAQYAFFWFTLAASLILIYGLRFFGKKS